MEIELLRYDFQDTCTIGQLTLPADAAHTGPFVCFSIELPWMDGANIHGKSAILCGRYRLTTYQSPHLGYEVLLLLDVPGRDFVEMHIANRASELLGCIAPGMSRGPDHVNSSLIAFYPIRDRVKLAFGRGEEIWLSVLHQEA